MDDYAQIEFAERNADHRRPTGSTSTAQPVRTVYLQRPPTTIQPLPPQVVFAPNAPLFGRMTGIQLVDVVGQIFAALMPLPAAPVATSEAATDVGNLILYQSALAQYAKRDEQIRTLGNLIKQLVG